MMLMTFCAMYFAGVHLGDSVRLRVLVHHGLKEAKRFFSIPDFRHYALLERYKRPFLPDGRLGCGKIVTTSLGYIKKWGNSEGKWS